MFQLLFPGVLLTFRYHGPAFRPEPELPPKSVTNPHVLMFFVFWGNRSVSPLPPSGGIHPFLKGLQEREAAMVQWLFPGALLTCRYHGPAYRPEPE